MKKRISQNYISLADLYLAYRKAKSEAFYDSMNPCAIAFVEYEQNLSKNLSALHKKITSSKPAWFKEVKGIGSFLYVPKGLDEGKWDGVDTVHYRAIDPVEDWKRRYQHSRVKLDAKYRLIISPTVDFHVISALWILKVGHIYEAVLHQERSFGNRLRRYRSSPFAPEGYSGQLNTDSSGLFQPYFSAYRAWREKGLKTMVEAIGEGQSIHAITMDLAGFYHNVSPKFLLRDKFLEFCGIVLSDDEVIFTRQLILAMDVWYRSTPDSLDREQGAIPVGLSASKIIANVLLHQFDEEVSGKLKPLYYGRYVDDIFLVLPVKSDVSNGDEVLAEIEGAVRCVKKEGDGTLSVRLPYAQDSNLVFSRDKQKIFSLSSEHGVDLVNHIFEQINKQSSEYRLLANLPSTSSGMAAKALLATSSASLEADALRKADVVSVRRLGFAMLLSDVEDYAKNLSPDSWSELRHEFYGLVDRHLLNPKGIFDFTSYVHRVFSLMVSCQDFDSASAFIDRVIGCFDLLGEATDDGSSNQSKFYSCKIFVYKKLYQAGLQAATTRDFLAWKKLGKLIAQLSVLVKVSDRIPRVRYSQVAGRLLYADLGSRPYKDYWYYSQDKHLTGSRIPKSMQVKRVLRLGAIRAFRKEAELFTPHWKALAFPTRPLTVQEIALICPKVLEESALFERAIHGLRGAKIGSLDRVGFRSSDDHCYEIFNVPAIGGVKREITIALTNFSTSDKQWLGALKGVPDRSLERYSFITGLINRTLREPKRPSYVAFPECSVPHRWAVAMAQKLARSGVGFICGLEYHKDRSRKKLRNDALISLPTFWPGYLSSVMFLQSKLEPSHSEKKAFRDEKRAFYKAVPGLRTLPVYRHGDFCFGVLICSDLTNVENRRHFQGRVDSLFVLEWNQDVDTFSFLVESAAHDIHTYIVQINNRLYGDSRIRAPLKKAWLRDSVRVKGGVTDFYVLGHVDYESLRRFQRRPNTAGAEFKPLPIGFSLSKERKL